MLWGGLQPIPRQVALDAMTLLGLAWALRILVKTTNGNVDRQAVNGSTKLMLASCVLTLSTSGASNRWTLSLPMVPLLVLHFLHRWLLLANPEPSESNDEERKQQRRSSRYRRQSLSWVLAALSFICIAVGAALSVLFPALELPLIDGPYNVGMIQFYIPMEIQVNESRNLTHVENEGEQSTCSAATLTTVKQYLPARLLYPTSKGQQGTVPYLNPETAIDFCRHCMRFGAPGPLKPFGWILHTWRLTTLPVIPEAPVLPPDGEQLPLVVHSHGLGGTLDLYSYQTMSLAAHGAVVLVLTHMDGSAPVVPQPRGMEAIRHDHNVLDLHFQGKTVEYVRARRGQTDRRVQELLGATDFLHRVVDFSDDGDETELEYLRSARRLNPYLKHVNTNQTFFMGHSFGGATALTAAVRRPDLVKAVIAHEPAIDWAPDDCRRSLFATERLEGLSIAYDGGTGGFETEIPPGQGNTNEIHDLDILVLNSHEWMEKGWGLGSLFNEMHQNGRFGKRNGISSHGVVKNSTHNEFSDTSMLTPLWLARPTGLAGSRNPIDTAFDIAERTRSFVEEARRG